MPANLTRLRQRSLSHKRSLALRDYALGLDAQDRVAGGEPLWRVHECVFAFLAPESEPVDPACSVGRMTVIGVPYHLDEHMLDLDFPLEPDAVVTAGLPAGDPWERMAVLQSAVASTVAGEVASGACPVVMSGDCNTSAGIMAGLQRAGADPSIVWFDAHGDVQTLETTTSGYLGGLALRLLTGYRPELIAARLGLHPVPEDRIVLAGARDLDPPEVTYLTGARITRREVAGLSAAGLPDGPLYVHVDLDVINGAGLPGLRFPAPGGPDAAELASALRVLLATGQVAAFGVSCSWYPGHDSARHVAAQLSAVLE